MLHGAFERGPRDRPAIVGRESLALALERLCLGPRGIDPASNDPRDPLDAPLERARAVVLATVARLDERCRVRLGAVDQVPQPVSLGHARVDLFELFTDGAQSVVDGLSRRRPARQRLGTDARCPRDDPHEHDCLDRAPWHAGSLSLVRRVASTTTGIASAEHFAQRHGPPRLTPRARKPYGRRPLIERVVLHQNRFRTPGLVPDPRGVALGPLGVVLLASPERLVTFLRATGDEGALDEMLDTLRILQVISPLRTREVVVEIAAHSSHRMDRVAGIARLVGGMVFTGSGRHFVKYRDVQAPYGYDIGELLTDPGDIALYHDRFAQPYKLDRTIAVRDLILRLAPVYSPGGRSDPPRTLYVFVPLGLGDSILGYLARWSVNARVARIEWNRGGTSDVVERGLLLMLSSPAPRFVQLLRSLPGVRLFLPDGERAAVEFAHKHPIPLSACTPLFGSDELVLFRAGGDGAIVLTERPPFVDIQTVTSLSAQWLDPMPNVSAKPFEGSFSLPLALVATSAPPRRVSALVVPMAAQDVLGRLLSVMPPSALGRLSCAFTETEIFVYGPESAHSIPLGTLYEELGDGVFVPMGRPLSPPIPPEVLRRLARVEGATRIFVTGGKYPLTTLPENAFVPATNILVADIPVFEATTVAAPLDEDRPLPDLWPTPPGLLAGMASPGARGKAANEIAAADPTAGELPAGDSPSADATDAPGGSA